MVTDIVGGSIGVDFNASFTSLWQIVSETDVVFNPATQTISPAITLSVGTFVVPEKVNSFVNLPSSTFWLSKFKDFTVSLTFAIPWITLPTKHLPRKESEWSNVDSIAKGLLRSTSGSGTWFKIKSNKGCKLSLAWSNS